MKNAAPPDSRSRGMQCIHFRENAMTDQIQSATTQSGLSENSAGGLAYLTFIPAIIFLVMEPYNRNPFIKFHAWQSILLTGAWVAWVIVRVILGIALHFIWFLWFAIGAV